MIQVKAGPTPTPTQCNVPILTPFPPPPVDVDYGSSCGWQLLLHKFGLYGGPASQPPRSQTGDLHISSYFSKCVRTMARHVLQVV